VGRHPLLTDQHEAVALYARAHSHAADSTAIGSWHTVDYFQVEGEAAMAQTAAEAGPGCPRLGAASGASFSA